VAVVAFADEAVGEIAGNEGVDEEMEKELTTAKKKKVASELIEIMESIPTIMEWLKTVDKGLSGLFERHFGMGAIAGRVRPEKCYVELLRQVSGIQT
jgi:hypothetical protein